MTKERLRKYQALKRERDELLIRRDELKNRDQEIWAALTSMTTKQGDGLPGGSKTSADDKMVNLLHRREQLSESMEEIARQYADKVVEMDTELLAIEQAITCLGPTARTLLRYRYLDGLKWEDICVKMNYSWTQIHEHHGRALQELRAKTE